MKRPISLATFGLICLAGLVHAGDSKGSSTRRTAHDFQPGQIWKYNTRPGEAGSTLTILKVEDWGRERLPIVHIRIDGVRIKAPKSSSGFITELPHAPISRAALDASVTELVKARGPVPDYQTGYDQWMRDRGGVFSVSVAELVGFVETGMSG